MSKTYFGNGSILSPSVINGLQNPTFVSKGDYPPNTSQYDLEDGEIFKPEIDAIKDLTTTNDSTSAVLSPDGNSRVIFRELWGGKVKATVAGTIGSIGIPVIVEAGSILDSRGATQSWLESTVEIPFSSTKHLYVTDSGVLSLSDTELPRSVPHTTLAEITVSANAVISIFDLRPHTYVGAHNDTPLALVNTSTITANYTAKAFDRVIVDSSGGSIQLTLPQDPQDGDRIAFVDLVGSFNSQPLVLTPYRVNGASQYTISDSSDDWLFNANYTFVQLVYIQAHNTWVFEAIPDSTCKNRGVFAKCGGAISNLITKSTCETAGYNWENSTSQCFRPSSTGLYSDGNSGYIEIPFDDRCELDAIEMKGRFLRCRGTDAIYQKGNGTTGSNSETYIDFNSLRCGGSEKGEFLRCEASIDGLYQAVYQDGDGGELSIRGDSRCSAKNPGRFVKCLAPGVAGFGDTTVSVGVYEKTTPNSVITAADYYLFDDPVCRTPTSSDKGRFLRCRGSDAVYQSSPDGSTYNVVRYDSRCYTSDRTGDIKMSMKQTSHGAWLLCNGSTIPSQYTDLIALLGNNKTPDARNRNPRGAVSPGDVGEHSGDAYHVLSVNELPSHNHTLTLNDHIHTLNIPNHTHSATQALHDHSFDIPNHYHNFDAGSHTHTFSGTPHGHTGSTVNHEHTVSIPGHDHVSTVPDHSHTMRSHTHTNGAHTHDLYVWYSVPDEYSDNNNSFSTVAPVGLAGEKTDNSGLDMSYITNNAVGQNLVGIAGSNTQTSPPDNNNTDGVTQLNNWTVTSTNGAGSFATTEELALAINLSNSVASGNNSPANISGGSSSNGGITDMVTSQKAPVINIGDSVLTGTTSNVELSGNIGNTGLGSPFSLLSPAIDFNFFIHV